MRAAGRQDPAAVERADSAYLAVCALADDLLEALQVADLPVFTVPGVVGPVLPAVDRPVERVVELRAALRAALREVHGASVALNEGQYAAGILRGRRLAAGAVRRGTAGFCLDGHGQHLIDVCVQLAGIPPAPDLGRWVDCPDCEGAGGGLVDGLWTDCRGCEGAEGWIR